jgi:very-short-patch-repair endonuclease
MFAPSLASAGEGWDGGKGTRDQLLKQRARALRSTSTDAERHLWRHLRQRQLMGFRFRRQVSLASYIADFACLEAHLVIELDGGQHQSTMDYDERRDEIICALGYRVLRFWNNQVLQETDSVLQCIAKALKQPPPQPSPALRGRGSQ